MATIDMSMIPKFPVVKIYDPDASVFGVDVNTSKIATAPFSLHLSAIPAGTTAKVQVSLHIDAPWVDVASYDNTTSPAIHTFAARYNFVRVVRSGAGLFKVYGS